MVRVPNFLVIGGMKCATTTLHQDLEQHPLIACGQKELNALTEGKSVTPALARKRYQDNFLQFPERSPDGHSLRWGDVSTTYSMLPDRPGIAQLAHTVCGPNLKVIYVVREPIRRAISHHQHMMNFAGAGRMPDDINQAIDDHPELIHYSRYAFQLQPWLEAFGRQQLRVIRFEDYVSQRTSTMQALFAFLGVPEHEVQLDPDGANRSESKRVAGGFAYRIRQSLKHAGLLTRLPPGLRDWARNRMLKPAKQADIPPTQETLEKIREAVAADRDLAAKLDLELPTWD